MAKAVLLNDTRVDLHHGCDRVWQSLVMNCATVGIDIFATAPAHVDWKENHLFMQAFETADLVIVNGEGTIHHDKQAGDNLLDAGRLARQQGIPAALINCTWESNGPEFKKKLMDFSLISVRETLSEKEIASVNIKPMVVPDLSLEGLNWHNNPRKKIGFGDSVARHELPVLHTLLKATFESVAFPIQYPQEGMAGFWQFFRTYIHKSDLLHPKDLARIISNRILQWRNATRDSEEFIRRLSHLSLLISGRFHSICAAMGTGTPFLALESNSHKVRGMLIDAGLISRLILPSGLTEELMQASTTWKDSERESLYSYLSEAACLRKDLFNRLAELVD